MLAEQLRIQRARGGRVLRGFVRVCEPRIVRMLFSTTAGSGHFGPLIPVARACLAAGHQVRVAAPASFASAVGRAGLEHAPFADVPLEVMGPVFGRLPALSFEAANATVIADVFARLDAQAALPGLTELVASWGPDLIVRESCEFGSLAAAERAGIPHVEVAIGIGSFLEAFGPILWAPLAELSVLAGLPADRVAHALARATRLTSVPAVLDGTGRNTRPVAPDLRSAVVHRFRDPDATSAAARLPEPWGDPEQPLVYVTFGSVTAGLGPFAAMYRQTLEALADLPVRVLMTTGGDGDVPVDPVPANAHVESWWPQADVMAAASAMIGHGGFGTTMLALAAGVPQVVAPLFASDQVANAERVAGVGAGIQVPAGPAAVTHLPAALKQVLADPAFRARARVVAADIAALPEVTSCLLILEDLART